jgi:hypothetical protein
MHAVDTEKRPLTWNQCQAKLAFGQLEQIPAAP